MLHIAVELSRQKHQVFYVIRGSNQSASSIMALIAKHNYCKQTKQVQAWYEVKRIGSTKNDNGNKRRRKEEDRKKVIGECKGDVGDLSSGGLGQAWPTPNSGMKAKKETILQY